MSIAADALATTHASAAPSRAPRRLSRSVVLPLQTAFGARAELAESARRTADDLERDPSFERLFEAAEAMGAVHVAGNSTLCVVASDVADAVAKLRRAAERLGKIDCARIHDSAGIYYYERPLATVGKLAYLFPGEGAQYIDMLGDVAPHFAIVRDYIAVCDRHSLELSARGEAIGQLLCVPDDWDDARRRAASAEFADLGAAMFAVLVADRCYHGLFEHLGVKADATCGHSMGEFCALTAGGGVLEDTVPLEQIVRTIETLETDATPIDSSRQAEAVDEIALLAVGAGRSLIEELATQFSSSQSAVLSRIEVGMDNCPHQSVAVGEAKAMAAFAAELKSRGILFERVPFRRPYHTPAFEPYLGKLDAAFDGAVFCPPRIPVYSCTTAAPFPADPVAVRSLAVAHWAAPVEFTRTIERMHADGVRIFVEAGPSGNLTAFVEDILRGKEFAAIAANVRRRPGMLQLHHAIAQLAAHGVPIDWHRLLHDMDAHVDPDEPSRNGIHDDRQADGPSAVMQSYLRVMDQFLDLQASAMARFFGARTTETIEWLSPAEVAVSSRPLLGSILTFEAGRALQARRTLTLEEVRFAGDHTVGGRKVSRVFPEQHGLPVMPMTGSLEVMAEHAELLVPGFVVVAIEDVRLGRWLAVDDPPHDIAIAAEVVAKADAGDDQVCVVVAIHDLGPGGSFPEPKLAAKGTVVLAAHRPEPPIVDAFPLANDRPCRISIEVLYRNLFHGPMFLGVRSLPRVGDDGIEAEIEVLDRTELIGSTHEPDFILDPVLLDVTMHPLAAWHLEQPDQAGRILLPIGLKRLEVFADPAHLPPGERLASRGRILEEGARHFVKNFETVDSAGRLLYRIEAVQYWRFYVPFGDVNFHGPKDEYFLSKKVPWSQAAQNLPRQDAVLMWFDPPLDIRQPVIRGAAAKVTLGPNEFAAYRALKGPEPEIDAWLFCRIAAKDAARQLWFERYGKRHYPADLHAEFPDPPDSAHAKRQLSWRTPGDETLPDYLADIQLPLPSVDVVSLDGEAVAIAAFAPRVGVAACKWPSKPEADDAEDLSEYERAIVTAANGEGPMLRARISLAKQAAARAFQLNRDAVACKDFDIATGTALVQVGEQETIDVWTTLHGAKQDRMAAVAIA